MSSLFLCKNIHTTMVPCMHPTRTPFHYSPKDYNLVVAQLPLNFLHPDKNIAHTLGMYLGNVWNSRYTMLMQIGLLKHSCTCIHRQKRHRSIHYNPIHCMYLWDLDIHQKKGESVVHQQLDLKCFNAYDYKTGFYNFSELSIQVRKKQDNILLCGTWQLLSGTGSSDG